jgi:hypothetical protein
MAASYRTPGLAFEFDDQSTDGRPERQSFPQIFLHPTLLPFRETSVHRAGGIASNFAMPVTHAQLASLLQLLVLMDARKVLHLKKFLFFLCNCFIRH